MTSSQQSPIERVVASVFRLHGGERDQLAKRRAYLEWLVTRPNTTAKIIPSVPHRESEGDE